MIYMIPMCVSKQILARAVRFTDPASVDIIMDMIGTKGVLNTEHGLLIVRPRQGYNNYALYGDWVTLGQDNVIRVIPDDVFTETFEEMPDGFDIN